MEAYNNNRLHIVLADDDHDDAFLFNEALNQTGMSIQFERVENGEQLLQLLDTTANVDVVFLDINMPVKNGVDSLLTIRADSRFKTLPILVYSTTENKAHIEACYNAGANYYIVKPDTFSDIVNMLKKICNYEWTTTLSANMPEYFVMTTF